MPCQATFQNAFQPAFQKIMQHQLHQMPPADVWLRDLHFKDHHGAVFTGQWFNKPVCGTFTKNGVVHHIPFDPDPARDRLIDAQIQARIQELFDSDAPRDERFEAIAQFVTSCKTSSCALVTAAEDCWNGTRFLSTAGASSGSKRKKPPRSALRSVERGPSGDKRPRGAAPKSALYSGLKKVWKDGAWHEPPQPLPVPLHAHTADDDEELHEKACAEAARAEDGDDEEVVEADDSDDEMTTLQCRTAT